MRSPSTITPEITSSILVVDDDRDSRILLRTLLTRRGHSVLTAGDGVEGIRLFQQHRPELVLMDVRMPHQDGYETTQRIRALDAAGSRVPVIFLTAVENERELALCLDCGGDDFLNKPVNGTILEARIRAWLRKAALLKKMNQDRESIENVLLKMRASPFFDPKGIDLLITPVERTTGDLLLSCRRPDGVQHVLLGDFTGHGLPAAIGGPLASNIFFTMTRKGFSPLDILTEINIKVHDQMPTGLFLAATFLEVDRDRKRLGVFNGGMPEVLLFRASGGIEQFSSGHLALGIRRRNDLAATLIQTSFHPGDRLFGCSDGVVEAARRDGAMLGVDGLREFLIDMIHHSDPLDSLLDRLQSHSENGGFADDITMVEVAWDSSPPTVRNRNKPAARRCSDTSTTPTHSPSQGVTP